jgi:ketosteroid isomerase-like protein
VSELNDFVEGVLARHLEAVDDFHSGDTKLWREAWSAEDPVTLFGPGRAPAVGRKQSFTTFEGAAARLSRGSGARVEVLHAEVSGNLGVIAGLESSVFSVEGGPVQPQTLRVTMIYRREGGVWRLAHRHADPLSA